MPNSDFNINSDLNEVKPVNFVRDPADQKKAPAGQTEGMLICLSALMECSDIGLKSMLVTINELNKTTSAMTLTNDQLNQFNYDQVPITQKQWVPGAYSGGHWSFGKHGGGVFVPTWVPGHWETPPALTSDQLNEIMIANEQISKARDNLSNKMMIYQQTAQVQESSGATKADYSSQNFQETSTLMSTWKSGTDQLGQMNR